MIGENGESILINKEILNNFNDHFGSIINNLDLDHWDDDHSLLPMNGSDRIDIIKRLKNHPNIEISKQNLPVLAVSLFSQFLWLWSRQLLEI